MVRSIPLFAEVTWKLLHEDKECLHTGTRETCALNTSTNPVAKGNFNALRVADVLCASSVAQDLGRVRRLMAAMVPFERSNGTLSGVLS